MAYIDKINPAMPEGRIVVRDGQILLKDKGCPMSTVPLSSKWQMVHCSLIFEMANANQLHLV